MHPVRLRVGSCGFMSRERRSIVFVAPIEEQSLELRLPVAQHFRSSVSSRAQVQAPSAIAQRIRSAKARKDQPRLAHAQHGAQASQDCASVLTCRKTFDHDQRCHEGCICVLGDRHIQQPLLWASQIKHTRAKCDRRQWNHGTIVEQANINGSRDWTGVKGIGDNRTGVKGVEGIHHGDAPFRARQRYLPHPNCWTANGE